MTFDLKLADYVEWKVYEVTPIKGKLGYRVKLIYMDGSDTTQQKSGFQTQTEAEKARIETIGELYSNTYVVFPKVKVSDFFIYWLEQVKRFEISDDSYGAYKNIVYNYINPKIGKMKMSAINRGDIQRFYKKVAEKSTSVARLLKTVVTTGMEFAVSKKIISENPAKGVDLPKVVEKKKFHERRISEQSTYTLEQIQLLIKKSKDTRIHMQILFAVLMGLRRGKINGLKYSDVDFVNKKLRVERQLGVIPNTKPEDFEAKTYTKQEIEVKTNYSERELDIPDYVFEAILEQRKIYEKNRHKRPNSFQDLDYICCSSYGRPRSKCYYWKHYVKLLEDCGLPHIKFHDLRGTYTTLLLKNNINEKAVSLTLGHAKEIITVDVYGDTQEIIEDCVVEIEPFIEEVIYKGEEEMKCDYSDFTEIDQIVEEYLAPVA